MSDLLRRTGAGTGAVERTDGRRVTTRPADGVEAYLELPKLLRVLLSLELVCMLSQLSGTLDATGTVDFVLVGVEKKYKFNKLAHARLQGARMQHHRWLGGGWGVDSLSTHAVAALRANTLIEADRQVNELALT